MRPLDCKASFFVIYPLFIIISFAHLSCQTQLARRLAIMNTFFDLMRQTVSVKGDQKIVQ